MSEEPAGRDRPTITDETGSGLRIDKWLWFVRFFKTRSLATAAVKGGHVRVNGARAKPGYKVVPGDRVEIQRRQLPYEIVVTAIPRRRGPAREAQRCYSESVDAQTRRRDIADRLRSDRLQMPLTQGRPDKRTRRALRQRNRDTTR